MARKRKGETSNFLTVYLASHPGSTTAAILTAAREENYSRASIHRALQILIGKGLVRKARGRHWLGRIEEPALVIESEVERTYAILRSSQFSPAAKLEAARQLARESTHASPRSREVVELLSFVASARKEIRIAFLPFVFRAMQAAVRADAMGARPPQAPKGRAEALPGTAYSRRLWEVVRGLIAPFLRISKPSATIAWNTVYEAVDAPGLLGDTELLELAELAMDIEMRTPLPSPSAARAVLRRAAKETRLRDSIRLRLFRRVDSAKSGAVKAQGLELARAMDVGPFSHRNQNDT